MLLRLFFALNAIVFLRAQVPGRIVPDQRCLKNELQGYALYLPANYSPERKWPVLMAFDPRARGLNAVERFSEAAETYGWIVAGSNNSRNGPWDQSATALAAMSQDLFERFAIDEDRIYVAGMSGGARVAFQIALGPGKVAGAIAASAAFPAGQKRDSVPFPVFGTAGTEDFNWLEMKDLDRSLKTRHRVRVFEGGHVWMPKELATEAVEWMELEAMKSGLRPKDAARIEAMLGRRKAAAERAEGREAWEQVRAIGADFESLHPEASAFAGRARQMEKERTVKDALKAERKEVELELDSRRQIGEGEGGLNDPATRRASLDSLREKLGRLAKQAKSQDDSAQRRVARRIVRGIGAGPATTDPQYRELLNDLGMSGRPILKP